MGKKGELTSADKKVQYFYSLKRVKALGCVLFAIFIYWWLRAEDKSASTFVLFAAQETEYDVLFQHVTCSSTFMKDTLLYSGCKPAACGRFVLDNVVTNKEVDTLLRMVQQGLSFGGSEGGASVLDVYTGAMSKGVHFVNVYKLAYLESLFTLDQIKVYERVCNRLLNVVAENFHIPPKSINLTRPTFFSRFTNRPALTVHDVYWSPHVDKITYPSFHYTTLLYLNDFGNNFTGGQFNFLEADNSSIIIEPRKGRVLMFSSGEENKHYVSRVISGVRYALTIAFTCDESKAIHSPFNNPYIAQYHTL